MKITLDNDEVVSLYSCLGKDRGDLDKMQIKIRNGRLQLVATNGQILGVFERLLRANEAGKDCSFLLPLKDFGKPSFFKKKVLTLTSDGSTCTLSVGACNFVFEMKKGNFPNWEKILIKDGEPLQTYRVFNPDYLKIVSDFVPVAYKATAPLTSKVGYGAVMWTEETNMYKKIVMLMPLGKI